jgi:hypothetical protein
MPCPNPSSILTDTQVQRLPASAPISALRPLGVLFASFLFAGIPLQAQLSWCLSLNSNQLLPNTNIANGTVVFMTLNETIAFEVPVPAGSNLRIVGFEIPTSFA